MVAKDWPSVTGGSGREGVDHIDTGRRRSSVAIGHPAVRFRPPAPEGQLQMSAPVAIMLSQINPTVGDVLGNLDLVRRERAAAASAGADILVLSELVVCGYPPEDLVLKPFLQDLVEREVTRFAAETADGGPAVILGAPWRRDDRLYNTALVLDEGRIAHITLKHLLPNYGVFDEMRVFHAGPLPGPVMVRGLKLGLMVCEDVWTGDVSECLDESGAELLVVINGSPFEEDKRDIRLHKTVARVVESGLPLIYVNQVGGQDELVFDGSSFVLAGNCSVVCQMPAFRSHRTLTHWRANGDGHWTPETAETVEPLEPVPAIYAAMTLGLADYVNKNGFPGVLIGLSGGIDSALSAAVAVDALGPERVRCVMMPSPYTSADSLADAAACAAALGVRYDSVSIEPAMAAFAGMLDPLLATRRDNTGIALENVQSRARGLTLMALSNTFGDMVLSTGNKSEMSVGYATLYGDMCGGYSVLKDVYKTTVYELARWRNRTRLDGAAGPDGPVIPERILTKAPSAELRPDQTDQDSLPPYDVLDDILACLIESELSAEEIIARGHPRDTVNRVWRLLDRAEYKRRQAPPGVKLTRRSFGRDRRYPITNQVISLL